MPVSALEELNTIAHLESIFKQRAIAILCIVEYLNIRFTISPYSPIDHNHRYHRQSSLVDPLPCALIPERQMNNSFTITEHNKNN